ncbi:amino acid adenylation domain-containing protein [Hazenella sp. IB182353]|uniref:hybrid non-ribosomal peptide synthetase/type I polyketide synthase n=1 Tax=Polycladospora coralii TaxID=2771432 RepID=UPI0017472B16|nr:non-ribosomal peptide synthetase [Polycladospora coralii]MBS7531081.1 amino acid adenylation domain-containing protein [Polycladospora coralii]
MTPSVESNQIEDILKLTPTQEGILYHCLKDSLQQMYFGQVALEVSGQLEIPQLEKALQLVAQDNECLRSVFKWEKLSHPVQVILRQMNYNITKYDWVDCGEREREESMIQIEEEERSKGFDLTKGPLLRISICKLTSQTYRILVNFHHIIMDGWSMGVFFNEWFEQYGKILSNQTNIRSTPKKKYKEYIKWFEQQDKEKAKIFWADLLSNWEPTTKLPYKVNKDETNIQIGSVTRSLADLMPQIEALSNEYSVTVNSVLNVAWGIVLQRYSSSDDVTFGLTVSGRPEDMQDIDKTIGLFINTIPVRISTQPQQTVAQLIGAVHKQNVNKKDYEYLPLTDIHSSAKINGRESLFNHLLVFENYPLDQKLRAGAYSDFKINQYSEWELNNYDISVAFLLAGEPQMKLDFKAGLFDQQTMQRMIQHFEVVLKHMLNDPEGLVKNLEILPEWEKVQTVSQFNQTKQEFPHDKTVFQLFLEQVKSTPELDAVAFQNKKMSYEQLHEHVNDLVIRLQNRGMGPGKIVSIKLDWSIEMIIAIMGVLGTGAAYVPIDPNYPRDRIDYILKDSRSELLITSSACYDSSIEIDANVMVLDQEDNQLHEEKNMFTEVISSPNDLAYVIYTSGSTGRPKGVMVEQQSFVEFVTWAVNEYEHRLGYQVLLSNSFAFDSSLQQIFPPLVSGGTLHLLHPSTRQDARDYLRYLQQHKINNIDEIPVIMNILLEQIDEDEEELPLLPDLTCLSLGSEYVPIELVRKCRTYLNGNGKIINGYGPAEASVETCTYHFNGYSDNEISLIGRPRRNMRVYILDHYGRLCPIGTPGEICVSGVGLARGYLNQPDLTTEKFIDNSFSGIPGDRLYKTGDKGRWLIDGNVEYLGRVDQQVKIRGFRVELGEIENVLLKHPQINGVVVIARKNDAGQTDLYAYLKSEYTLSKHDLNFYIGEKLPTYMIPVHYEFVSSFPLTPNGKVDRKILEQKELVLQEEIINKAGARHELDQKIEAIWKEVLGIEQIGIYTNFFEAGGNSIQIMRVFNKLKKIIPNLSLEISDLFTYNTIAGLADFVLASSKVHEKKKELSPLISSVGQTHTVKDMAIIGVSIKLPDADHMSEWWEQLLQGQDSIREIPDSRKHLDPEKHPNKEYLRYGYIEGIDQFDPQYFNISPKLAKAMDPNQRMMLETAHSTIEDAGYTHERLASNNVGVFMGAVLPSYLNHLDIKLDELLASNLPSNLAGRISYHLGLNGPSMVIDTACSSSLVALHTAMKAVRQNECDMALVGGIHIEIDHIRKDIALNSGIVSPTETCRAFSDDADGTIGGEGSVCILIKPLEKAVKDHDHIYAVLKGSAVVQDGARSNGITAPSPDAQAETIVKAWQDANIDPTTISYIEAHGTGTRLGDPIEVSGIQKAYQSYTNQKQFIAMGSVKTNIGHLDSAAGLAGLVKTILSIQNKNIPPVLHYTKPNVFIDFENSPVYVNNRAQKWQKIGGSPRRAGISSFGLSGTNVHVVLEEYEQQHTYSEGFHLITLSAPNEHVLNKKINDLKSNLSKYPQKMLADISYTLNCRRKHDQYRFSVVVKDRNALLQMLGENDSKQHREMKNSKKIILCFQDYEVGAEHLFSKLCQTGWMDENIISACQKFMGKSMDPKVKYVAFLYSMYHLYQSLGIEVEIHGVGIGQYTKDFILGTKTFEEVMKLSREPQLEKCDHFLPDDGKNHLILSVGCSSVQGQMGVDVFDAFTLEKKEQDFLSSLSRIYQMGYHINLEKIQKGRTVSLPTYPFQHKSYWLEQSEGSKSKSSLLYHHGAGDFEKVNHELLHGFDWTTSELSKKQRNITGAVLMVSVTGELHSRIVSSFTNKGQRVIQLFYGKQYRNFAVDQYEINPHDEEHFVRVMKKLRESEITLGAVIDLTQILSSPLTHVIHPDRDRLNSHLADFFYPTVYLVKSMTTCLSLDHPVYTFFITKNAFEVVKNDDYVNPLHSFTVALNRSMNRELNQFLSFCIDVSSQDSPSMIAETIYKEVFSGSDFREVAYRNGKRHTKVLKNLQIDSFPKRERIRESGVYLVTGGTGGIAQKVCKSIAEKNNVTMILVGRTSLQELSASQMQAIEEIRHLGSNVQYYQANLSSREEMEKIVEEVTATFGKFDGVIHTAGVLGRETALKDSEIADFDVVFEAKVKGTIVLDQLLRNQFLDFFILFSSVDAVLAEKNIAPYVAANAFLDSYALCQRQLGRKFLSIQWGGWQNTGMGDVNRSNRASSQMDHIKRLSPLVLGFKENEGVSIFHTILGANASHSFISGLNGEDLEEMKRMSFFDIDSQLYGKLTGKPQMKEIWTLDKVISIVSTTWREVLEFEETEELNPRESYFSLGGDSIQAIDIMMELSNRFSLNLDANTIFHYDSVHTLSQFIYDSLQKPQTVKKVGTISKAKPIK